ncbi:MAG TPA: hypothetical protein VMS86_15835 [Thermoanaerobaculia bacterium]|nr:hypothetical protein [Thermoanaerobaculia bacterium]
MSPLDVSIPGVLVLATLTFYAAACGSSADSSGGEAAPAMGAAPSPTPQSVVYEPAYPEEVSEEGLSQDDVSQQQTSHRHDGSEAHAHDGDDGSHTHDESETHPGEADHGHPH